MRNREMHTFHSITLTTPFPYSLHKQDESEVKKRFETCEYCLKSLDLDLMLETSATQAFTLIIRWLKAIIMARNIALALAKEAQPPPADPVADSLFDEIDVDKNGYIDSKELVMYMVKEFTHKCAHSLLRVLDADADKKISREEWRRGWADGALDDVLLREHQKTVEAAEEGARMRQRREGGVMAMTAAAAAHQLSEKRQQELLGGPSGKKGVGKKKK